MKNTKLEMDDFMKIAKALRQTSEEDKVIIDEYISRLNSRVIELENVINNITANIDRI